MYLTENDIEGLENVLCLLNETARQHYTISQLSTEAGMSTTKFKKQFKFYTGSPVFTFQKARRLNTAYRLLTESRLSPGKISRLCGYKYLCHFNKAFKERFKISPFKLRKALH